MHTLGLAKFLLGGWLLLMYKNTKYFFHLMLWTRIYIFHTSNVNECLIAIHRTEELPLHLQQPKCSRLLRSAVHFHQWHDLFRDRTLQNASSEHYIVDTGIPRAGGLQQPWTFKMITNCTFTKEKLKQVIEVPYFHDIIKLAVLFPLWSY